ncbi:MAG TPA: competence protein [Bacilli bacterium]|nr:competence protein [Bacilli bacterium]
MSRRRHVSYLINVRTMALESIAHEKYGTRVYEKGGEWFYVKERPLELIKAACIEGGASYEGRTDAVRYRMNHRNKLVVPISPSNGIIALPTHSSKSFDCSWLMLVHVRTIISIKNKKTRIVFCDGQELDLDVSSYVIETQMNRASRCFMVFREDGAGQLIDYGYSFVVERKRKGKA